MKLSAAQLFRPIGTINRGSYAIIGLLGFALKHNLDRIVATYVFHRPWDLFNYWIPIRDVANVMSLDGAGAMLRKVSDQMRGAINVRVNAAPRRMTPSTNPLGKNISRWSIAGCCWREATSSASASPTTRTKFHDVYIRSGRSSRSAQSSLAFAVRNAATG